MGQVADSHKTRLSSENCLHFKSKVLEERAVLPQGPLVALSGSLTQDSLQPVVKCSRAKASKLGCASHISSEKLGNC